MAVPDSHNGLKKEVHSYRDEITLSRYTTRHKDKVYFSVSGKAANWKSDFFVIITLRKFCHVIDLSAVFCKEADVNRVDRNW